MKRRNTPYDQLEWILTSDVWYDLAREGDIEKYYMTKHGHSIKSKEAAKARIRESIQVKYIKEICDDLGIRRADIKILAGDVGYLYFRGEKYAISLNELDKLRFKGTDLLIIEKQGIAESLNLLAAPYGIALLSTRGFLTENAIDLSVLAKKSGANVSILTDNDISGHEFEELVENVRSNNLDILYKKVKSIWQKYVDADDFHISLCTADTIFTYFQDKIGLTHYPFFVGGNTSGKSNNLTILYYLAYRNMKSSGITYANIYQFLGSDTEGLGTICEDEADNIDQDHDKMRIYKNGYTTGVPVFRIDTSFGRKQYRYNTFCFKAFAAEKLPDSVTAKGFNERTIDLPCLYGFPQYDISEVINEAAGDEEYQHLLNELDTMHNALIVYRLLHFQDKIPNIKLNIQNREKQLFKPILRVFQNTETLNELLPVVSKYVSQKRENNANTLHAYLYRLVSDLTKAQDTYELESSLIWNTIKETLQGKDIANRSQSYDTVASTTTATSIKNNNYHSN